MATAQNKRKAENAALLNEKSVKAALFMISKAEGTFENGQINYGRVVKGKVTKSPFNPNLVGKSNVVISDFSRHPQILVSVRPGLESTAAGFAQFIFRTWTGAAAAMGLTDFSPYSQQLAAVELIRQRGAINYILRGDIPGAIANTSIEQEWASFAGAGYGQGEHSVNQLSAWFREGLNGSAVVASENSSNSSVAAVGGASIAAVALGLAFIFLITE